MIIIAGTLEFQNLDARDEATAQSSVLQLATREGEEGCRAYSFAPDPCVATRIQVYELWTDEDCLSAHFKHPNYLAMRDLLRSSGLVGSETLKYRIDLAEPVYDDNHVTIDGPTELALSDDAAARFRAYGWHVLELGEAAEDLDAIENAFHEAMAVEERPSLVVIRSHIGHPSPDVDSSAVHGYSLTSDGITETKARMGLPEDDAFWVPDDVLALYRQAGRRGAGARADWEQRLDQFTGNRAAWDAAQAGRGVAGWADALPTWEAGTAVATRKAGNACIQALLDVVPGLLGGGADLTGNTGTTILGHGVQSLDCPEGRQLFFGVREHAMGAICNGLALHGGMLPVNGTFLVFSDYMRGAVRLAALSAARTVFVWSHDSVGVGEDGPTHQPVEHAAALRAIPDLPVFRPADANETAGVWRHIVETDGPAALLLTRQDVPVLSGTDDYRAVARGGYVLAEPDSGLDVVLIGTGSEVAVALDAAATLTAAGRSVRVVSMPCTEVFAAQDDAYRVARDG